MNNVTVAEANLQNDILRVSGKLDFYSVQPLYAKCVKYFGAQKSLNIDFSDVTSANSAALALIVDWIKLSRDKQTTLTFTAIPSKLLDIAKSSGMLELLQPYQR